MIVCKFEHAIPLRETIDVKTYKECSRALVLTTEKFGLSHDRFTIKLL